MAFPRLNPMTKSGLCSKTYSLALSKCFVANSLESTSTLSSKHFPSVPLGGSAGYSSSTDARKENFESDHWPGRRELVDTLNGQVEAVLRHLNLEPNPGLSGPDRIRVGSKGSLSIVAREFEANGARVRSGTWYNFETEEKGDMLTLVGKVKNLEGKNLYRYAVREILPGLRELPFATSAADLPGYSKLDNLADRLLEEAKPIKNSLAEVYLKSRGLTELGSSALFFHPALITRDKLGEWLHNVPGLLVAAGNPKSSNMNIQVTYLGEKGSKHADAAVQRRTIGTFQDPLGFHSCLLSPGQSDGFTFVAEGTETALSVLQVLPDDRVIATLGKGNMARIDPDLLTKKVVLILDNDGTSYKADSLVLRATRRLLEAEREVFVVVPDLLTGTSKTDMNDVLVQLGEDAVFEAIKSMKRVTM